MPYFIRVLSPNPDPIPVSVLSNALAAENLPVFLSGADADGSWGQVNMKSDGRQICVIERDVVAESGAGRIEIEEFLKEIAHAQPDSAAKWLANYLRQVKSIYAIQVLFSTHEGQGSKIVSTVKGAIWNAVGGIIQADNEGFTNEDGDHILWQFSDAVEGDWWMAVLQGGSWRKFRMDLGNAAHRASFLRGEMPPGLETAH